MAPLSAKTFERTRRIVGWLPEVVRSPRQAGRVASAYPKTSSPKRTAGAHELYVREPRRKDAKCPGEISKLGGAPTLNTQHSTRSPSTAHQRLSDAGRFESLLLDLSHSTALPNVQRSQPLSFLEGHRQRRNH